MSPLRLVEELVGMFGVRRFHSLMNLETVVGYYLRAMSGLHHEPRKEKWLFRPIPHQSSSEPLSFP